MDRRYFISPRAVRGTTIEGKLLRLLNSFTKPADFKAITDQPTTGFSSDGTGYGVGEIVAKRILAARPAGGYTSIFQIASTEKGRYETVIDGLGEDKFTDLLLSSIALTPGTDHRTLSGNFRRANPEATGLADSTIIMKDNIEIIAYCSFRSDDEEILFPFRTVPLDTAGNFIIDHLTDDFEKLALVARFKNSREIFHRSGLLPIKGLPTTSLSYRPVLIQQEALVSSETLNTGIAAMIGTETDGSTVKALAASLRNDFIEINGTITKPDTFLWFDSDIEFTNEIRLAPTQFAGPHWVSDFDEFIGVSSQVVKQNHTNVGFFIVGILLPVVGMFLIAKDASLDHDFSIRQQIDDALREGFNDSILAQFAERIQREVDEMDLAEKIFLATVVKFEENPKDLYAAIAEYMISHKTLQSVSINGSGMTFNVWLTLPLVLNE